jgi:dTMP kinase
MEILTGFIVLEGLDGSGTTTQLNRLFSLLSEKRIHAVKTCEPTEKAAGQLIRRILGGQEKAEPETVALLFAADRNEHLYGQEGIAESCRNGNIVISDRYLFSSLAYQSVELDFEYVYSLNRRFPLPEYCIYLNIDPEHSLNRLSSRESREIYENIEFQKNVRKNYEQAFSRLSSSGMKFLSVDGSADKNNITAEIFRFLAAESPGRFSG